jgi:hypothetical protein
MDVDVLLEAHPWSLSVSRRAILRWNMIEPFSPFLQRCVSVDLEVDPATATVFAFAAVRDEPSTPIVAKKRDLVAALDRLEAELSGTLHLIIWPPCGLGWRLLFDRRSTPYGSILSHFRVIPTTTWSSTTTTAACKRGISMILKWMRGWCLRCCAISWQL